MKRVYIQQNFIAHYRKAVFELLSLNKEFEFTIIADSQSDTPSMKVVDWETSRIRRQYARTANLRLPLFPTLFWQPMAAALVARDKPDLIIALGNPYSLTSWVLLLMGRLWSGPVFLWGHGLLKTESGPKWWLRRTYYRLAKGLLLYGDHAKDLLVREGFANSTLKVVYNALDFAVQKNLMATIDSSELETFRLRVGVEHGEGLIAFTGRLQKNKKLWLLIDSLGILRARGRVVHVALIGDGPEKVALTTQAKKLGIVSQLHFLGETYDERFIATVLMASDLSVIPSGAGLSVMHALGYGLPVLLHDRPEEHGPEWEAIREGETGFFYKYGDVNDMADKIETALFPIPRKMVMKDACLAVIGTRYNASSQAEAITSAVKQALEVGR